MKCLLLLAVVLGVAKAWEPTAEDDKCIMCGDPLVRTFSGTYLVVTKDTKTLMMEWQKVNPGAAKDNVCKFQIECVTVKSSYWIPKTGPLWVDWCGVGFWPHKVSDKFFRNWLIGQDLDCMGERGQGFDGMVAVSTTIRKFPNVPWDNLGPQDTISWPSMEVPLPTPADCTVYTMKRNGGKLEFRSNPDCDCGWAIDWIPCERNTCIIIYSQASKHTERHGKLEGICGPMSTPDKDWSTCNTDWHPPASPVDPNDPLAFDIISAGCNNHEYLHFAEAYIGSTKLHGVCGNPGGPMTC